MLRYYCLPINHYLLHLVGLALIYLSCLLRDRILPRVIVAEAGVSTRAGSCGIGGGQTDDGAHFSMSISVLPCRHHSTIAPRSALYISLTDAAQF